MEGYQPPFTITNRILSLVADVSEKVGQMDMLADMETQLHLRKNSRIKSIHSSLKIEANSLSLNQVRDVINGKQVLGEQREIQEVKNAYAAYDRIRDINPYSIRDLKHLHGIMTKYLIDESGSFRKGEEGVFDGDVCIFMAPPAKYVPELMTQLFNWMKKMDGELHPLILGAVFHYEFVFIHPFADGNGRMARLWHSVILCRWNPIFEYIPIESQIEKFQNEYYDVIDRCHGVGESTQFIEFMLTQIDSLMGEVIPRRKVSSGEISDNVGKLLSVMDLDIPYTGRELMDRLELSSREGFRRNYLRPALEADAIQMTIPDKPRSRNQKYIRR